MNPFLHSTVAVPRPNEAASWETPRPDGSADTDRAAQPTSPSASHAGRRRTHLGLVRRRGRGRGASGSTRGRGRAALVSGVVQGQGRARGALRALMLAVAMIVPGMAVAVDVNVATPEQLQEIKGVGPKMARTIIAERERGGRFESMADLSERVKGIGPKKAAAMQSSGLAVGGEASKPQVQSSTRRRP